MHHAVRSASRWRLALALATLAVALVTGCGEDEKVEVKPTAVKVLPPAARPGEPVSVWGNDLGGQGAVQLGATKVDASTWTPNRVEFVIPANTTPGATTVQLKIGDAVLEALPLEVLRLAPEIAEIEPFRAKVGDVATVKGKNFGPQAKDSGVTFYGTEATEIKSWSDTEIQFKIPKFKEYGYVQVHVGNGLSNQVGYRLIKPEPAEIVPPTGELPKGTLTIKGNYFGDTPGQVLIGDNRKEAKVLKWTDKAIDIEVPPVWASDSVPYRVVNDNGTSLPSTMIVLGPAPEGEVFKGGKQSKFVDMYLDDKDFPHSVWYEDHTHCAVVLRWNGLKWELGPAQVPMVNGGKVIPVAGWYPSLCPDGDGGELLSFLHVFNKQLWFGVFAMTDKVWNFDIPDGSPNTGTSSCVRRAPDGSIAIAYFDDGQGHLKLARGKPKAWKIETVDTGLQAGMSPSMEFDAAGNPRIAYLDFAYKGLKYAAWDPAKKAWAIEYVTGQPKPHNHRGPPHGPAFPQLKLDSKGTPHIVYLYRQGDMPKTGPDDEDGVRHAFRSGDGQWQHRLIEAGDEVGFAPSLDIGPRDRLVAGYFGHRDSTARVATSSGDGKWKVKAMTIKDLSVAEEPSAAKIRLGHDGRARIACWVDHAGARRLAYRVLDLPKE